MRVFRVRPEGEGGLRVRRERRREEVRDVGGWVRETVCKVRGWGFDGVGGVVVAMVESGEGCVRDVKVKGLEI